jgi:ribosomal protein S12 methylthiotransferase accessory factor
MITWLAMLAGRAVSPDISLGQGHLEIIRQFKTLGVAVEVYLLDSGLPFSVAVCLALGDGRSWPAATVALGAGLGPRTAVQKSLSEQGHVGPYVSRLMQERSRPIPERPDEVRTLVDHALYYVPRERVEILDFLRAARNEPVACRDLAPTEEDSSLERLAELMAPTGLRVAFVDVTSPDTRLSPFRVVRALGEGFQSIDFGFALRRLANPRMKNFLHHGVNPHPHPLA